MLNLTGLGVPMFAALLAIPPVLSAMGAERFGLLTLVWAVVSYFGLFDLGLGRVLTRRLAVEFEHPRGTAVGALVGTAMTLMLLLGSVAGALMALGASGGVGLIKAVPDHTEAVWAVYAMAVAMPAIVLTSGLRGVLEARRAFGIVNTIRLPMGLFTFLAPWAVVTWASADLAIVAWVLCAGRWFACMAHAAAAAHVLPMTGTRMAIDWRLAPRLASDGGWMTVSNIVSPFMGYADRFVIGVLVSASAVAIYATPLEVAIKLSIVPAALTSVLFPMFAVQMMSRPHQSAVLMRKSVSIILGALLPACVALALFAEELLGWWIDAEFAFQSAFLLRFFAIGILINCLAHVPLTLLQGAGSARTTALIHLVELPAFLAILWWATSSLGLWGAAATWLFRMSVDTALMFGAAQRLLSDSEPRRDAARIVKLTAIVGLCFMGALIPSPAGRAAWLAATLVFSIFGLLIPALRTLRATQSVSRVDTDSMTSI